MTKTEETSADEFGIVKRKVSGLQKMLDEFQVETQEQLEAVADKIKDVKILAKWIKQEKDKYETPAKEIIEKARAQYTPALKVCENAEIVLKQRAKAFMLKQEAERTKQEAQIAAKVESGKMKPETAIKKMESLPDAPKTVSTDTGSGLSMRKRKVAEITDRDKVPDEFWVIDEVRVRREALERDKYGKDPIPGVIIREETDIASV